MKLALATDLFLFLDFLFAKTFKSFFSWSVLEITAILCILQVKVGLQREHLYTKRRTHRCLSLFLRIIRTRVTSGCLEYDRCMCYQHSYLKIAQLFVRFDTYVCTIRFRRDIKRNAILYIHTRSHKDMTSMSYMKYTTNYIFCILLNSVSYHLSV